MIQTITNQKYDKMNKKILFTMLINTVDELPAIE